VSELDAVVVGGGISGLATAHCLARSGLKVELWESASRVGGKIHTASQDGYCLDSAASMVMNLRNEVDAFIETSGLDTSKLPRAPGNKRYVLDASRLQEVPTGFGKLLRTPLLSTAGKLRLLAEPLVGRGKDPHESVAAFVGRRLGREFLEKVFEPYLAGPLASDVDHAEAVSTMPRLRALESRYGSLALGALLHKCLSRGSAARPQAFSFSGGMASLTDGLARNGGFRLRKGLHANGIWPVKGGWMVAGSADKQSRTVFARQLVLSTPAGAAARLVHALDPLLAELLGGIDYAPIKVVHTGFERARVGHPLGGSGFLVPRHSGFECNGCLWISSLFPGHAPAGKVLLTTYLGGARNPAAAGWDQTRCLDAVSPMLRKLLAARGEPDMVHIASHQSALPLYHGRYSERLSRIAARLEQLPGLHLEANYRGGVSVRDRILCAQAAASRILRQQQEKPARTSIWLDSSKLPDVAAATGTIS
jgi:oxygen-dependent protoporphyrinogen oxidase